MLATDLDQTIDIDAFDFDSVPLWFDRHPSQAEGDDF